MINLRKVTTGALVAVIIVACTAVALTRLNFYQLTGRWFPIRKVDTLRSPLAISGWGADGLRLADGRTVQLPGFRKLPSTSAALTAATRRGVEVADDGRVYGLVEILHGCGNDPVREHVARIDLGDLLMYLGEGEWITPLSAEALELAAPERRDMFSQWGLGIGHFMQFESWQCIKNSPR